LPGCGPFENFRERILVVGQAADPDEPSSELVPVWVETKELAEQGQRFIQSLPVHQGDCHNLPVGLPESAINSGLLAPDGDAFRLGRLERGQHRGHRVALSRIGAPLAEERQHQHVAARCAPAYHPEHGIGALI
jgi:hypothetical protein